MNSDSALSLTLGPIGGNSRSASDGFIQKRRYSRLSHFRNLRHRTESSSATTLVRSCLTKQYPRRQARPTCTYLDGMCLPQCYLSRRRSTTTFHLPRSLEEK